ncbi:LacI family transcriptional regulator [Streptomyces sp. NBC_01275]|uniref:LacI family DNA-binding transcriptional regulator n=1 Tax=Streptomyces sp. NBC_01275 TaxID=2903807 RepID=UPI00225B9D28|nr:LacI family DNA-binding transcriptional regulator [Streptomyces sp. NBC_01275]MCX4767944.1 LacI family transcriptional regulator [Streptomyces sp. NBC_01275]
MPRTQRRSGEPRVTAAHVAERAGVSVGAVSLVVNGKAAGRVSPAVAERIREAVRELGYVVDQSASLLSSGSSRTILLVAPDLSNPFYGSVIRGVRRALGETYQLLLPVSDFGRTDQAEDLRRLKGLRAAGVLIGSPSPESLTEATTTPPTVLVDSAGLQGGVAAVNLDVATGARELARHLASIGHRHVGYLDNETASATFVSRSKAFWETAAELGVSEAVPRAYGFVELEAAAETFREVWPAWHTAGVTAVVCSTDVQAYGVLLAAQDMGIDVPGRLAVAGFDDLPYSKISRPALTTVALPGDELGFLAGSLLRSIIDGDDPGEPLRTVPGSLVIRESTAAPVPDTTGR